MLSCELSWDLTTSSVLSPCTDCVFTFNIDFTYDASVSTVDPNSSNCQASATDTSYDYGLVEDYDVAGNSALMVKALDTTWTVWFTNGDLVVNNGSPAVVDFSNGQFNYSMAIKIMRTKATIPNWVGGSASVQ